MKQFVMLSHSIKETTNINYKTNRTQLRKKTPGKGGEGNGSQADARRYANRQPTHQICRYLFLQFDKRKPKCSAFGAVFEKASVNFAGQLKTTCSACAVL
jgi:hypothetical protein